MSKYVLTILFVALAAPVSAQGRGSVVLADANRPHGRTRVAAAQDESPAVRTARLAKFVRPTTVPAPEDNPITPAKVSLGQALFFDPRLSRAGVTSCASCHNPGLHWQDGLPKAVGDGMQALGRRTQVTMNLAWDDAFFWDGRAGSLEEQALGPIMSMEEMAMGLEAMVARLQSIRGYAAKFEAAYGVPTVTPDGVAKAIATYERTLVSGTAPFDRWIAGDEAAVSAEAKRGFDLFTGKANCAQCHAGWRFTDGGFYDIGIADKDEGRGAVIPGVQILGHAFKAPTLRNIAERAPYLHNGSAATLEDVIELYDRGGDVRRPSLSPEIKPLGLSPVEKRDLVAFLRTLTSVDAPVQMPLLPN